MKSLEKAFKLVVEHGMWADKGNRYIAKVLTYAHENNYLWLGKENGEIKAVAIAYRIKDPKDHAKIPEKSEGEILYVPLLVSKGSRSLPLKMMRSAVEFNKGVKLVQYRRVKNVSKTTN